MNIHIILINQSMLAMLSHQWLDSRGPFQQFVQGMVGFDHSYDGRRIAGMVEL